MIYESDTDLLTRPGQIVAGPMRKWLRKNKGTPLACWLRSVKAFRVVYWGLSSADPSQTDRVEVEHVEDAHVVSSLRKDGKGHDVVLDIDIPLHVIESSTPGHHHLVIEVPGDGIPHEAYMNLLTELARCGVIEPGYKNVSKMRGHSDIRVPWLRKGD